MIKTLLFLLLLFSLSPAVVSAQDLYSGIVPVQSQDAGERRRALPGALGQVLQKLSGQRELAPSPELDESLDSAERMLLSVQYLETEHLLPDGETEQGLVLVANFQQQAVDGLMLSLGLPRWRTERKAIVIWAVLDDGRGRHLKPMEYQYVWDTMDEVAKLRGLPIAWPELSEELLQQVDLQLLWGGNTDQMMYDSASSDGVVIAAARREGAEWNVRWTWSDASTSSSWRTSDRDLSLAMVDGLHQLTDLLASVNSIGPAGLGDWQVELQVTGLRNNEDYARCLSYLEGLGLVDAVDVLAVAPEGVRFYLDLNADPSYLQRSLDQQGMLQRGDIANVYRYLP